MEPKIFHAKRDARLRARIVSELELVYDVGRGPPNDRDRGVSAGSGIAFSDGRLVVIQDEADYVAVVDGEAGSIVAVPLRQLTASPASGRAGSGSLALEAVLSAKDWRGEFLLAFGAGGDDSRRCIARLRLGGGNTEISVFRTPKLYAQIQEAPGLCTVPLDVQGVAWLGKGAGPGGREGVRIFHRAHSPPLTPGEEPEHLSATVDVRLDTLLAYLERCKRDPGAFPGIDLENPRRYHLNDLAGAPFGFTDAATTPDGLVVYTAEAVATDDAGGGVTAGVALGIIEADGEARYTMVVEKNGDYTRRRVAGLAIHSDGTGYLALDPGEGRPARLATLESH